MASWQQSMLCLALLCSAACAQNDSGVGQAFRIRDAQFFAGELPGYAAGDEQSDEPSGLPSVTSIESANLDAFQGQGGKSFHGRVSNDTSAVAFALSGVDGYWVVPASALDPTTDELTWNAVADFDVSVRAGKHALRVVAIDAEGNAGAQAELPLCVSGRVPDNLHACYPERQPPYAVVSLHWDVNSDIDLQVVAPDGRVIDAKHRSTAPDADADNADAIGLLDRDSNAGCAIDGQRTENLVWNDDLPVGNYDLYVNLFDACKQPAVRFVLDVYTSAADASGESRHLVRRLHRSGELLDFAANPAAERGLFVADFDFN